jgi:uncharacterized protein YydD (DUF2326 family)
LKPQIYTDKRKFKQDEQDKQDKKKTTAFIVLNYPVSSSREAYSILFELSR